MALALKKELTHLGSKTENLNWLNNFVHVGEKSTNRVKASNVRNHNMETACSFKLELMCTYESKHTKLKPEA